MKEKKKKATNEKESLNMGKNGLEIVDGEWTFTNNNKNDDTKNINANKNDDNANKMKTKNVKSNKKTQNNSNNNDNNQTLNQFTTKEELWNHAPMPPINPQFNTGFDPFKNWKN